MNKVPRKVEQKLVADHAVLLISSHTELPNLNLPKRCGTIREIQYRAETMTPVLKAILDFRPPPHW
jgi:hypothetical protein